MAATQPTSNSLFGTVNACIAELPDELRAHVGTAAALKGKLCAQQRERRITTTIPALDDLLLGGLPTGNIIELIGRRSSGRLSILLSSISSATAGGQAASLIDLGGQLDPRSAAEFGIELNRLLWVRPQKLDDALAAAYTLVETGFALIALDLGLPPLKGRVQTAIWVRLRRIVEAHRTVVLVGSPYRVTGCAATVVVAAQWGRGNWTGKPGTPRLLRGLRTRLTATKLRGRRFQKPTTVFFTSPEAAFAREETPSSSEQWRESHVQTV